MAHYDISSKITNKLPTLVITEGLVVTINNRKSTVLNIQAMIQENERKPVEERPTEIEMIDKTLEMLIEGKAAAEIKKMDLPIDEYRKLYEAVTLIANGQDPNETPSDK